MFFPLSKGYHDRRSVHISALLTGVPLYVTAKCLRKKAEKACPPGDSTPVRR